MPRYAFGPFELDVEGRLLRRDGEPVPVLGKTLDALTLLVQNRGRLMEKEELLSRLWPGTVVEEANLTQAIFTARKILDDSPKDRRYIATVPGRGYQFVAPVTEITAPLTARAGTETMQQPAPDSAVNTEPAAATPSAAVIGTQVISSSEYLASPASKRTRWIIGAASLTIVGILAAIGGALRVSTGKREIRLHQLTANSAEDPVWHAVVSPDGKYLAFGSQAGIQIRLISTGESHLVPKPQALSAGDVWVPAAWFPDGVHLLATSLTSTVTTAWAVSVIGGTPVPLRDDALVQSVSPDGSLIAFTTEGVLRSPSAAFPARQVRSEIWLISPGGENARKVVTADGLNHYGSVRWSPDGKRIAYQKWRFVGGLIWEYSIESRDLNGAVPAILLSAGRSNFDPGASVDFSFPEDFWWLRDGRLVYAAPESLRNSRGVNLWQVNIDPQSGKPSSQPRQIANLAAFHIQGFSATADGTRLVFEASTDQAHVVVGRLEANGKLADVRRLTHVERFESPFAWAPDGKSVIFNSDRNGTTAIYKQALDQGVAELIASGPDSPVLERVSPDGASLIYETLSRGKSVAYSLMRVSFAGRPPQLIFLSRNRGFNFDCPHRPSIRCVESESSSDGQHETFASFDPASGARSELFQLTLPRDAGKFVNWTLSPDGTRIAMTGADSQDRIEVRSLAGKVEALIEAKGWPDPVDVDWAADGKSVFISHIGLIESPSGPIGVTILRVDLEGHVQPLWDTRGGRISWAVASPDGKYLAIREPATQRNAWMIENF